MVSDLGDLGRSMLQPFIDRSPAGSDHCVRVKRSEKLKRETQGRCKRSDVNAKAMVCDFGVKVLQGHTPDDSPRAAHPRPPPSFGI